MCNLILDVEDELLVGEFVCPSLGNNTSNVRKNFFLKVKNSLNLVNCNTKRKSEKVNASQK